MLIFDTNSCFQCIILKISSKPIINMQTKYSEFHSQTLGITELIKKILMDISLCQGISLSIKIRFSMLNSKPTYFILGGDV